MQGNRDTWRYEVRNSQNEIVKIGITSDPDRREAEHRRDLGAEVNLHVQGPAVMRTSAEDWEQTRLEIYQRNHGGDLPPGNNIKR